MIETTDDGYFTGQLGDQKIATAALDYIQDGDMVILDAGTTTLALAQLLKEQVKSAFIITCSVPAVLELSSAGYDIILLGGMVQTKASLCWGVKRWPFLNVTGRTKHSSAVRALLPKGDTAR